MTTPASYSAIGVPDRTTHVISIVALVGAASVSGSY